MLSASTNSLKNLKDINEEIYFNKSKSVNQIKTRTRATTRKEPKATFAPDVESQKSTEPKPERKRASPTPSFSSVTISELEHQDRANQQIELDYPDFKALSKMAH